MKYLFLFTLAISNFASAQNKPISTTYNCTDNGCALTCLNFKNNWTTLSSKAKKVTVTHYTNGNIEFLLNHSNKGTEAIFISEQRLSCKISGIQTR